MTLMNMLWARREAARTLALCAGLVLAAQASATAGPLRERWQQRSADLAGATSDAGLSNEEGAWVDRHSKPQLPPGTRLLRDVAYGSHPLQRMDVYLPAGVRAATAILLVHGGGWSRGDKAHARLVHSKVVRWLAQGVVVSVNYRLLPGAAPLLGVCSTRRHAACGQAQNFAARARTLGVRVQVLAQDLSHGEINEKLGLPGPYTEAVEAFLHSLDGWRGR